MVFEEYLYAKKTVLDFEREIHLLQVGLRPSCLWRSILLFFVTLFHPSSSSMQEFVLLNRDGIRKIVKKFDKKLGTAELASFLESLRTRPDTKV